ncbi:MAG: hypothetical protein QM724_12575 [Flavobacteriales bacterium]
MPRILPRLLLTAVLAVGTYAAQAQGSQPPPRVLGDLCGCVGNIDPAAPDRQVNTAVRICLEDAVVRHPGEVLALLEHAPAQGSRAYQLGLVLGDVLQRDCPDFRMIQARLQQMPIVVPAGKHGT